MFCRAKTIFINLLEKEAKITRHDVQPLANNKTTWSLSFDFEATSSHLFPDTLSVDTVLRNYSLEVSREATKTEVILRSWTH